MKQTVRMVHCDRTLLKLAIACERDGTTQATSNLARVPLTHAWAVLEGGMLIGAGGLVPIWPGRAEGWMLVSAAASRRQIAIGVCAARAKLDDYQRDPAFARVEYYIRADAPWLACFAAELGFTEAPLRLRRWGPAGEDFCLFARVKDLNRKDAGTQREDGAPSRADHFSAPLRLCGEPSLDEAA